MNRYDLYMFDCRIADAYENACDPETGEISPDIYEYLDSLEMERNELVEGLLLEEKEIAAYVAELKAIKKQYADRLSAAESKLNNLHTFNQNYLNGEKFKTARVETRYTHTEVAVYDGDVNALPDDLLRFKAPEVNKEALKKALKSGFKIEGARLEKHCSMTVK